MYIVTLWRLGHDSSHHRIGDFCIKVDYKIKEEILIICQNNQANFKGQSQGPNRKFGWQGERDGKSCHGHRGTSSEFSRG